MTSAAAAVFAAGYGSAVSLKSAPVAQLDRANASGALGREFESLRAHHFLPNLILLSRSALADYLDSAYEEVIRDWHDSTAVVGRRSKKVLLIFRCIGRQHVCQGGQALRPFRILALRYPIWWADDDMSWIVSKLLRLPINPQAASAHSLYCDCSQPIDLDI
jgi:hypothetical protein